jgi:hypothetical protein
VLPLRGLIGDEIIRTFVFTVTAADPDRVCRWANIGHRWSRDPITAGSVLGERHPASMATTPAALIGPIPIRQLSATLRANAKGLLCVEAAIELLINQQSWLWRKDFVTDFIDTAINISQQPPGCFDTAFVNWVKRSPHSIPASCPARAAKLGCCASLEASPKESLSTFTTP